MEHFFASCPRGLENHLADELSPVGASHIRIVPGGLEFSGDWAVCYRANLSSRLATRILWLVSSASYHPEKGEKEIYQQVLDVSWERYFDLNASFRVQTTASRSPLKSVDFITLRVKDAICDRFRRVLGERPNVDTAAPDIRVQVYLSAKECRIYLDTSGAPLWQRGLRHANVEAPLKENLAAGILKISGWKPGLPLFDPMCGGGTFILEAACIALNRAPGLERPRFGFENLKTFQDSLWQSVRNAAFSLMEKSRFLELWGSDIDPRAIRASLKNLREAGLESVAHIKEQDFLSATTPTENPGFLIANPPYGERLDDRTRLSAFYPQMSAVLKRQFSGWQVSILTADPDFQRLLRLKPHRKTPLWNGPLECRLYEFEMVSGSNRQPAKT